MPAREQFPPYKGQINLSADGKEWVVRALHADGGGIRSLEFFQSPVLMRHLRDRGVADAFASHDPSGYRVTVWRGRSNAKLHDVRSIQEILLTTLQTHYAQHRGRTVTWSVR